MAGDHVEDNLNPVGRTYYGFSTLLCTPASLSQDVGLALGTQAGPARIRDVATTGGFTRVRHGRDDAVQQRVRDPAVTTGPSRRRRTLRGCAAHPSRAADPDVEGVVERDGVRARLRGVQRATGRPTVVLVPTWSIVPSRFWKAQVGYLARHYRVVTFDGRGSGRRGDPSARPRTRTSEYAADIVAVLDATGTDRAVLVSLSCGAAWAVHVAAKHPSRVPGSSRSHRRAAWTCRRPGATTCRGTSRWTTPSGWAKYNKHYWLGGGLRRLRRVLLPADVLRAALDQADRGLRRLGARDHAADARGHHRRPAGVRRRGVRVDRAAGPAGAVPGARGARHRRPDPAAGVRRAARRADRRRPGPARGRRARAAGARPGAGQPPDPRSSSTGCTRRAAAAHVDAPRAAPRARCTCPRPSGSATRSATSRSRPSCASRAARPADRLARAAPRDARARAARRARAPGVGVAAQRVRPHRARGRRARPARVPGDPPDGRDPGQQLHGVRRRRRPTATTTS